jgi:peptide/nickel transport system permease protein
MLFYLLKRVLAVIPTLWFITSVVFVLSKLIPGDNALFNEDESIRGTQKIESGEEVYRQFLRRTNQDLPLFYLSMQTLAEPDTLYKVLSTRDRTFLKQLIFHYGDWPSISTYFQHLQFLQTNLRTLQISPPTKALFNQYSEALFTVYENCTNKAAT